MGANGVEFDALYNRLIEPVDTDNDGKSDTMCVVARAGNPYTVGVEDFLTKLRQALGNERLILADGHVPFIPPRGFGILNGIESEGWPLMTDWEINNWSTGMNVHLFWMANGRAPAWSYFNHKYQAADGGKSVNQAMPWSRHRLVFAAARFRRRAVCGRE